jgi:hypothetical protein
MSSPDKTLIEFAQTRAEADERLREPMWSERQAAILEDDQPDRREHVGDAGRLAHELANANIKINVLRSDLCDWARLFLAVTANDGLGGCPVPHSVYTRCWRCSARAQAAQLLEVNRGR